MVSRGLMFCVFVFVFVVVFDYLFVCLFVFLSLPLGAVFCPSESFSGITWSMTPPGMSDIQRCPKYATGKVTVQYKKLLNFTIMRCLDLYLS